MKPNLKHIAFTFLVIGFFFPNGVFAQPSISGFSPQKGLVGSTITINGTGFSALSGANTVFIGKTKAVILSESSQLIEVLVPPGLEYGPITISTGGLTGVSKASFSTTIEGATFPINIDQFKNYVEIPLISTNNPYWINPFPYIIADIDGDQKPDIVTINFTRTSISIKRNIGSPSQFLFEDAIEFAVGQDCSDFVVNDFNGDGKLDIITSNYKTGKVHILMNSSAQGIQFMPATEHYVGSELGKLVAGDLNGDGKSDVIVVDVMDYGFYFLKNISTLNSINLIGGGKYASNKEIRDITLADVDGDQMNDILLTKSSVHEIQVFRNISNLQNFSLVSSVNLSTGEYPRNIDATDINADGKPDIISTDEYSNTLSIYVNKSNTGSMRFSSRMVFNVGTTPKGFSFGDLNGDGAIELGVGTGNRRVECYTIKYNNETINLEPFLHLRPAANDPIDSISRVPVISKMVDLDLDGKPELVSSTTYSAQLSIFRNRVNEPLIKGFSPHFGNAGTPVIIKGKRFLGVTEVSIGKNIASNFAIVNDSTISAIAAPDSTGEIKIQSNKGFSTLGTFFKKPIIDSLSSKIAKSGDIVTVFGKGFSSNLSDLQAWFGTVKANITAATSNQVTIKMPESIVPSPITIYYKNLKAVSNQLISSYSDTTDVVLTHLQFPETKIADSIYYVEPYNDTKYLADFNADGKTDWLVPGILYNTVGQMSMHLFKNNSRPDSLSFNRLSTETNLPPGFGSQQGAVADFNGDGAADLVVTDGGRMAVVLQNNADFENTSFEIVDSLFLDITNSYWNKVFVADINGDGKDDVLASLDWRVAIFINISTSNAIRFLPCRYVTTSRDFNEIGDFNHDGLPDLINLRSDEGYPFIFLNKTDFAGIKFEPVLSNKQFYTYQFPKLTDVDLDGELDVISTLGYAGFIVYRNLGAAGGFQFEDGVVFAPPNPGESGLAVGDLTGDGKPEIFSNGCIFKNLSVPGTLNFEYQFQATDKINLYGFLNMVDFDNDGNNDITTFGHLGKLLIFTNKSRAQLDIKMCPNYFTTDLPTNLKGSTYQWQIMLPNASEYTLINESENYQNTQTSLLLLKNLPSNLYGSKLRCMVDGKPGQEYVLKFESKLALGFDQSNWYWDVWKWSCQQHPDEYTDVVVSDGTLLITDEVICRSLTIKPGATVKVMNGGKLSVIH